MTTKKQAQKDIRDGAYTTPSGDPIVATAVHDEGDCAYCGCRVYSHIDVTEAGMLLAHPGTVAVWRWFRGELEPWHIECFQRWLFQWSRNANGTVHLSDCRYAESDGETYHGTRGEARHMLDANRFCAHCAPIEAWVEVSTSDVWAGVA